MKHVGDVVASVASVAAAFVTWLSRAAETATPILSAAVLIATLGWWVIRYRDWWRTGKTKGDA